MFVFCFYQLLQCIRVLYKVVKCVNNNCLLTNYLPRFDILDFSGYVIPSHYDVIDYFLISNTYFVDRAVSCILFAKV